MKIYNLIEKQKYLKEVAILEYNEWAKDKEKNKEERIESKINKIKKQFNENNFCKLILLDNENLVGFISLFPHDSDELKELSPWYSTMYVKKEYWKKGYSKILNDAILEEAKKRKIKTLYLKTELENYYEKFGAKYLKKINKEEKLYKFDL